MNYSIRERLFQAWYWYVNKVDKNADILFMNYGFHHDDEKTNLEAIDEKNRYSIQLYDHLATTIDVTGKDIVEIGCGRGGGLYHVVKAYKPSSAIGIDLDRRAVGFSNSYYKLKELSFLQGDAQNLQLKDNSADVIFNVESSHRYPDMMAFLGEVKRILRSGGHFLYTDFRYDYEMEELNRQLVDSGLTILKERNINKEVVRALQLDNDRRCNLVKKLTPRILHRVALNFSGAIGSDTYNTIDSGKYVYYSYVLQKK